MRKSCLVSRITSGLDLRADEMIEVLRSTLRGTRRPLRSPDCSNSAPSWSARPKFVIKLYLRHLAHD